MIDLSSKAVDKVRQPSLLMSPADVNSMQTTAIDIGISNRTSAKKIGSKEVIGITEAKNGDSKKKRNSRNSSTHRFSMTLNNVQFAKLQGGKMDKVLKQSGKELPGPGVYDPSDALSKDRIRSAIITKGPERFHELPR